MERDITGDQPGLFQQRERFGRPTVDELGALVDRQRVVDGAMRQNAAARPFAGFQHHDAMPRDQPTGRGQTGRPRTDDQDVRIELGIGSVGHTES